MAELTPMQRAQLFANFTRLHYQTGGGVAGAANSRVSIEVPKSRLLSKIRLLVELTLTATQAADADYTPAPHAPYSFIRNVEVKMNNGFSPFNVSGKSLYFYNLLRTTSKCIDPLFGTAANVQASRRRCVQGISSAAAGQANTVRFVLDLPLTLNDRDPAGIILAQNPQTTIDIMVDLGSASDLVTTAAGYSFAVSNVVITPFFETFSIPDIDDAKPDLSILKLVQQQSQPIAGAGLQTVRLVTGNTYRKLLVYIEDATGGETDNDLGASLMKLVLNTADYPVEVHPRILQAINEETYGRTLPNGLFVFDWASLQGIANYAGSRDYFDTEDLTEFWLQFTAAGAGNVTVITETLTKLRQ